MRSWQSRGGAPPPSSVPLSSFAQRSNNPSRPPPPRSRPSYQNQTHLPPSSQYRTSESDHHRERPGPRAPSEPSDRDRAVVSRGGRGPGGRPGPSAVPEDPPVSQAGSGDQALPVAMTASASPRRQQQERGSADKSAPGLAASASDPSLQPSAAATNRDASPPAERPVERKSYSAARRTRSRPADLGSKQPSVEESASPSGAGGKSWTGAADGPNQASGGGALTELDQDVARLSLAGQSWSQSPTSYMRSEMRGESPDWTVSVLQVRQVNLTAD